MAAGRQVILEIEVQGALQVREKMPEAHLVFIEPPSLEELERRLRGRGTETDDVVDMRMRTALVELSQKMEYDYQLVNDDLDEADSPARRLRQRNRRATVRGYPPYEHYRTEDRRPA